MTSSRAISASVRTASTMSADVLLRCPRRRRGSRCSVWAPPTQWMVRTISAVASSRSATASWMTVRTIRFLSRASVVGADQTVWRSFGQRGEGDRRGRSEAAPRVMRGDPLFDPGHAGECAIPAGLQLAGDEAVLGIGCVILAEGAVGGVARRLEVAHGLARLVAPHRRLRLGRSRRLRRGGLNHGQ